jgi:hypothetical protein
LPLNAADKQHLCDALRGTRVETIRPDVSGRLREEVLAGSGGVVTTIDTDSNADPSCTRP